MSAMRPPPALPGGPCETRAMTVQPHAPEPLAAWMGPFMTGLTRPTWRHALVLVAGAILAPGRRTVAAVLRVVGLGQAPTFTNYHRVLNRNRWSGRAAAGRLLHLLLAAIELLAAVCRRLTVVTRLRLDARLFDPPPPRRPGTMGRPRVSGAREPTLAERLADPGTRWRRVTVAGWYGRTERRIELVSGTALWHHPGKRVSIRWLLVRDVAGEFEPQGFLCTDPDADPLDVLRWFVRRWSVEVTFAEVRRHLGVETQRQWSDLGIARTTPALLGLFSLVTLWAAAGPGGDVPPRGAAWYPKPRPTFSDALATVRYRLWTSATFSTSPGDGEVAKIPRALLERLTHAACYPA